jgi:hypothetical protein
MLRAGLAVPEYPAHERTPLILQLEISAEQVDSLGPRLREALAATGDDGELARRAAEIEGRATRLAAEQAELEERARRLSEREAELGASDEFTASERIRFAQRRQQLESSEQDLEARENELVEREAEFEGDVLLREDRIERWRTQLTTLKEDLERRERDLATYVEQLQDMFLDGDRLPSPPGVSELRRTA